MQSKVQNREEKILGKASKPDQKESDQDESRLKSRTVQKGRYSPKDTEVKSS